MGVQLQEDFLERNNSDTYKTSSQQNTGGWEGGIQAEGISISRDGEVLKAG